MMRCSALGHEGTWKDRFGSVGGLFQNVQWQANAREIYQQIASELITIAGCDSVSIRLLALTGDEMIGCVYAGAAEGLAKEQYPTLAAGVGRMSEVFEDHQPLVYDFNDPADADVRSEEGIQLGYSHAVVVPLMNEGSAVGAVDFMFKEGQFAGDDDQLLFLEELCCILGPISCALSTAQELLEFNVGEETRRIGSELHDNFAQPLSVIALEADKALLSREDGDEAQLEESLRKISDLSRQSFGMMAEEVALLHSPPSCSEDLVANVRHYVENFGRQWSIDIALNVPDDEVRVASVVENQAMRILHEALSNVLRHARADHVVVTLSCGQGALELSVEDDGRGFDVKDQSERQLGLKVMEQRAASVDGRLTVASVPGEGTSVFADLPLIV